MSSVKSLMDLIAEYLSIEDVLTIKLSTDISSMLIEERYERDMTQKQFAESIGVTQTEISRWENGNLNMTVKTIARVCAKLGLVPTLSFESLGSSNDISLSNPVEGYVNCFDCSLKYTKGFDFYCPHSGGKPLSLEGGCILGVKKG